MKIPRRTFLLAVMFLCSLGALGVTQNAVILGQTASLQPIIIDNSDSDSNFGGNFTQVNSVRGFRGNLAYIHSSVGGQGFAKWTFGDESGLQQDMLYDVLITYKPFRQNVRDAKFTIFGGVMGQVGPIVVDQTRMDVTMRAENFDWLRIGTVSTSFTHRQIEVQVEAGAMGTTLADAVMFRPNIPEPVCGNGRQEGDEQCDDGNTVNIDACSSACQSARCGDWLLQQGEQCDDGNQNNADACSNSCRVAHCGDAIVQAGEECDDGNREMNDDCTNQCRTVASVVCGNSICEANERNSDIQCGTGMCRNPKYCPADCAVCGNFIREGMEQCDDGNQIDTDACSNACQSARCGDEVVQQGEQCDDGNASNSDSCRNDCTRPSRSGHNSANALDVNADGRISVKDYNVIENHLDTAGSGTAPAGPPYLDTNNDGFVSPIDSLLIINWLNAHATCWDGNTTSPEQCDDGNTAIGDGCSEICRQEPSPARPYCGNGTVDPDEQCDDGNGKHGDGCSPLCKTEVCGDNIVNNRGTEECDTGGRVGTVGQSMPRVSCNTQCSYDFCGDGVAQEYNLEQCDDGNRMADDGCDNMCHTEHAAAPELSIRTTVPATLISGTNVEYLFQVTNNGSEEQENVTLVSSFFEGDNAYNRIASPLSFISARLGNGDFLSCAYVADQKFIRCTVPIVEAGNTRSIVLSLGVPANEYCGRTLKNQADLSVSGYPDSLASVQGQTNVRCESAACRTPMLTQSVWQNKPHALDVNGDSFVTASDLLAIDNRINNTPMSYLPLPLPKPASEASVDTDGNGYFTNRDRLLFINYINAGCMQ